LVAKSYTQTNVVEYDDTFSHVTKISYVRLLVFLAINLDWLLYQLDVNSVKEPDQQLSNIEEPDQTTTAYALDRTIESRVTAT
jgi:hypothetical protein